MKLLGEHDVVVAAWAEPAQGPGWSNQPTWVLIRSRLDGTLRLEGLQPGEASADVLKLYAISAVVSAQFTGAVNDCLHWKRTRRPKKKAESPHAC